MDAILVTIVQLWNSFCVLIGANSLLMQPSLLSALVVIMLASSIIRLTVKVAQYVFTSRDDTDDDSAM